MAKSVSVAEAKRRFSDVVGAVRHGGERFVIERDLIGVQSRDTLRPEFWSTWRRAAWDAPCPSPR